MTNILEEGLYNMGRNNNCSCEPTCKKDCISFPEQHQNRQPGFEYVMRPLPVSECGKKQRRLENKVALITGGDSGIGRAIAYDFVREGALVAIVYYNEERDALETAGRIEELGAKPFLMCGDLKDAGFAKYCVERTIECFGRLDILVNNHAVQFVQRSMAGVASKRGNHCGVIKSQSQRSDSRPAL